MTQISSKPFGTYRPSAAQQGVIALAHGSFLKRGAFRPWLSRVLNLLRSGPVDSTFMGVPYRFYHWRSSADLGMLFNPDYNGAEIRFLTGAIPPGGVFVDVGTNIGMYSLTIARQIAPHGTVVGIEPHPEALAYLDFNLKSSGLKNFRLMQTAVGDFTGETSIDTDQQNLGASSIVAQGGTSVPIRPLLDVLNDSGISRIDALKIDIEGFEDKALAPFFDSAPESFWPKAVVIEHLHRKQWSINIIARMEQLGYQAAGRTRANTFLHRS